MIASGGIAQDAGSGDTSSNASVLDNRQLETCREGILDDEARDQDRRRWAELLFSYDSPDANGLIVSLLAPSRARVLLIPIPTVSEGTGSVDPASRIP